MSRRKWVFFIFLKYFPGLLVFPVLFSVLVMFCFPVIGFQMVITNFFQCIGKVVDMFYFPIIRTTWPDWMPVCGGESFVFFSPIFNFADAAISCGIIALLLFYHKRINL